MDRSRNYLFQSVLAHMFENISRVWEESEDTFEKYLRYDTDHERAVFSVSLDTTGIGTINKNGGKCMQDKIKIQC